MTADTDGRPYVWQPVMVLAPSRLECGKCRAMAIFVMLDAEDAPAPDHPDYDPDDYSQWGYTAWCRACFQKAQEGDDDDHR